MPYVLSFAWCPPSQSKTVGQRYLETLQKYPVISSIKRIVPAAISSNKEGIEIIVVDEVKREDIGGALEYATKFLVEFRDIEGFRYHVKAYNTVSEALSFVGIG